MPSSATASHAADIAHAVAVLRRGGVIAMPTETVYGLAADAANEAAVRRIFELKGRPPNHPLIVHLGRAAQLAEWARDVPGAAWQLAEAFWPGPLTLVLMRAPQVSSVVTGGQDTVALRVPAHPLALSLLRAFGGAVAAPSANRFGHVSPTTADHVRDELGTVIDYVLDGGPCDVGLESTIVDLSGVHGDRGPRLLRPGAITAAMLAGVLGRPLDDHNQTSPRVPGRLPSHYAPRARVVLAADTAAATIEIERHLRQGHVVGVLASEPMPALPQAVAALPLPLDLDAQARLLYARLREADRLGLDILVAIPPPPGTGLADAIRDRLARAAGPRHSQ